VHRGRITKQDARPQPARARRPQTAIRIHLRLGPPHPGRARLRPRPGAVGGHAEDRKTIQHPAIGPITVDCDVLADSDTDLSPRA
jgi:hypothetical protein